MPLRPLRRMLCGAVAVTALAAAPAAAQGPWSPPGVVEGAASAAPGLSFDARTVSWSSPRGSRTDGAPVAADGAVGAGRRLAAFGGDVVAGGSTPLVVGTPAHSGLVAPLVTSSGRTLVRRAHQPFTAVDAAAADRVAAIAMRCADPACEQAAPVLVVRRGKGFGRPVALDRAGAPGQVEVAVNPSGAVLAVWERSGRVHARMRTAAGRLLARQDLGPVRDVPTLSADLGSGRRAVIAAGGQATDGLGEASQPFVGWVAVARAGRPFAPRTRVASVPGRNTVSGERIAAVLPRDGAAVVAWTARSRGRFVVRAREAGTDDVSAPQRLSDASRDAHLAGLAAGRDGQVGATWLASPDGPPDEPGNDVSIHAAVRSPAASVFGPAELVPAGPVASYLTIPTAFDPAGALRIAYATGNGIAVATRDGG